MPLYQYNGNGTHFYTIDQYEIETITPGSVGKYRYRSEGIACHILKTPLLGAVPWYRYGAGVYSPFYTSNWQVIGTNIPGSVSNGMKMEGIIGYVFPTQHSNTCSLYRFVDIYDSQRFYTVYPCEIGTTTPRTVVLLNYKFEGIAAYVFTFFRVRVTLQHVNPFLVTFI